MERATLLSFLVRMMPTDLQILATFLYGSPWYGPMAADSGIRSENLRRLVDGRRGIPPALAEFLVRRTADRWLLRGWAEQRPPPGLSAPIAAELEERIGAARSWSPADE